MGHLRKYLQQVGLVSTLLIGGALGGLMAPVPSEAASLSIDGVNIPLLDTIGTGEGNKYTCEAGYSSCWYITGSTTATRTIQGATGTWTLGNAATSNRARVRINDVGGTPATNVDKMNLTGMILTPPANTDGKTTHIIINHTYSNGQGSGNYQWGMGATGYFDPVGTDTVLNNKFVLTGKGKFFTPSTNDPTGANDPELTIGKLDKGSFKSPTIAGTNGIVTQTVPVTTVKTGCNTDNSGVCRPTITYDFEVTVVGADALVLTDSVTCDGITCTDAELNPLIPKTLLFLMKLVDPKGVLPTHISGLNAWIDQMAVKYNLNPTQLAKLEKFKIALFKWLASQTCAGKVTTELAKDSASGVAAGVAAGGTLVTTCVDTNTCGTITISKNTSQTTSATFNFNISGVPFGTETTSNSTVAISMGGLDTKTTTVTVDAGTYSVSEINIPDGWTLLSNSFCTDGGEEPFGTSNFTVPVGGNVTCTFTNNKAFSRYNYQKIDFSPTDVKTWDAARAAARLLVPAGSWDLATITSAEEQAFIQTLLPPNPRDISGTHDYWIAGEQPDGSAEPGGNWRWATTGQVFYTNGVLTYANWGTTAAGPTQGPAIEPNNVDVPAPNNVENHVTMDNRYGWGWNDLPGGSGTKGYVAERVSP